MTAGLLIAQSGVPDFPLFVDQLVFLSGYGALIVLWVTRKIVHRDERDEWKKAYELEREARVLADRRADEFHDSANLILSALDALGQGEQGEALRQRRHDERRR